MDDFAVDDVVQAIEVGNIQRAHRVHHRREGLVRSAGDVGLLQTFSRLAEDSEDPGPIKALTFTVVAEAHGASVPKRSGAGTRRRSEPIPRTGDALGGKRIVALRAYMIAP